MDGDLRRRIGRFYVDADVVETRPADVMAIMGRVIVTRCEYLYHRGAFMYEAMSPLFRVLVRGEMMPEYRMAVKKDGTVSALGDSGEREG